MSLKGITSTLKFWQLALGVIIAVSTVVGTIVLFYRYFERRTFCQNYVTTADLEFKRDNFDKAIEHLNSALECYPDADTEARKVTVETFKEAAAYDQVRLVKNPGVLKKIDEKLRELRTPLGDTAELRVLQAVYEELSDRPNTAEMEYQRAVDQQANYANAYNSWGYTIYKWKLGGSGWVGKALEKLKKAAELKRDYGWPHVNMAAVYLELAENALTEKKDLDEAKKYLPDAKTSLETAEKLLPTNPRVDLLWGHYHVIQAGILKARGLTLEANDSYSRARTKLMQSKTKNNQLADTRVLLGSVYLELGEVDDAVYEFNEAVKLDDMNIIACARLVFALSEKRQSHREGNESAEIAAQVKRGLALINTLRQNFTARSRETGETDAKEWLATAVRSFDPLEKFLRETEQENAIAQAKSKPRPK